MSRMRAKPCQHGFQALPVFFPQRDESQSDSSAAFYMANGGIGSDASLLNEKIELGGHSFLDLEMWGLDKEAVEANVQDARDVVAAIAAPTDPDVLRRWKPR
ncbi:MAG: hypothetical protein WA765_01555 [Candidatus Acidiferrum sp.]